jgi:hypothetical protein
MFLVFLIGFLGVVTAVYIDMRGRSWRIDLEDVLLVGTVMGSFTTGVVTAVVVFAASAVGIAFQIMDRRNLLAASMQVAAYLGGYLVPWTGVAWGVSALMMGFHEELTALSEALGWRRDSLMTFVWFLPNIVLGVGYVSLVVRGTAGARYANK